MTPTPKRNFSLLDAMILVAATALGLAGFRAETGNHYHYSTLYILQDSSRESHSLLNWRGTPPDWYLSIRTGAKIANQAVPILTALTLAMLLIRLRRPRPSLRHLFRQPGMVAESAVLVALAVNVFFASLLLLLAMTGLSAMNAPKFYGNTSLFLCQALQPGLTGMAVVASWTILALGGKWRREPSWIDRIGCGLGLAWIAMFVIEWVLQRLH